MGKLYPPKIETTIPAIKYDLSTNDSLILSVPFQLNEAVASGDISKMFLLVKNVSTGTKKETVPSSDYTYNPSASTQIANFVLNKSLYNIGQYYKIQIAFVNNEDEVGYYSSVGIVKCTSKPDVTIEGLVSGSDNNSKYTYTGIYKQTPINNNNRDASEKVYSYCFTIFDSDGNVFDTSGVQLHNTNNDTEKDQSIDTWSTAKSLALNKSYSIKYSVTTINGLEENSGSYPIKVTPTQNLDIAGNFIATLYDEDAYVCLHLGAQKGNASLPRGDYVISRASSEDNFESWIELLRFNLSKNVINPHLCDDFTVVQGIEYKYGLQAVSQGGNCTNRTEAKYYLCEADENSNNSVDILTVEFEDAYLFDGERQLRIRYNPKVASFKSTILESKVDTLGGKYPFIFRNGNVEYKEFSISGLISALMDPNGKFLPAAARSDALRGKTPAGAAKVDVLTTDLSRDNFRKEREFKMEVLAWLTNGKPKLFRSPGEGNYIVRTMNASMSPNDTLGRMLHTFTCTAYEIAECNFVNLKLYELLGTVNTTYEEMVFDEVDLASMFSLRNRSTSGQSYSLANYGGARYLYFENQYSELIVELTYLNGTIASYNVGNLTGKYLLSGIENNPIINITYISGNMDTGAKVVFGYYTIEDPSSYGEIYHITEQDITQQFIGVPAMNTENLIGIEIENSIRCKASHFYLIKVAPKSIIKINGNKNDGYYYVSNDNVVSEEKVYTWDPTALYYNTINNSYYCGYPGNGLKINNKPNYSFSLNNTTYSSLESILRDFEEGSSIQDFQNGIATFKTSGRFESIVNVGKVNTLQIGDGLICDMVYTQQTYEYAVEHPPLNKKYQSLINAKTDWQNNPTSENYMAYLEELEMALAREQIGGSN